MRWLGNLWTNAVAYVALVIGSGLSIAGNVADTYRVRGVATDALDIVMAVSWPALVVLMVEMFVSRRWVGQGWPMQVIRWVGTIGIGGMAMRVSWVHLNDLMLSRGAATDTAVFGPLAIDALAIMATALILSGRGHAHVASGQVSDADTDMWPPAVSELLMSNRGHVPTSLDTRTPDPDHVHVDTAMSERGQEDMDIWPEDMSMAMADEVSSYLATVSNGGRSDTDTPAVPVSGPVAKPGTDRTRTVVAKAPADWQTEALSLIDLSLKSPDAPKAGEVDALLAAWYGVSDRTIRRLRPRLREEWG